MPSSTQTIERQPLGEPWIRWSEASVAPKLRLFCFPYAGGGPAVFRQWPQLLRADIEVLAIQLPGRAGRFLEPPYQTVSDMAADVASRLENEADVPFAFFGHSLGGLVAFEVARTMRRLGAPQPVHLFASASPAPHLPRREEGTESLTDDRLIAKLKRWNGTPAEIIENRELMGLVLPSIRADVEAFDHYKYEPELPFTFPITAFGGFADRAVRRSSLEAWAQQTRAQVSLQMLPGDHFFLSSSQVLFIAVLLERLTEVLRGLSASADASSPNRQGVTDSSIRRRMQCPIP